MNDLNAPNVSELLSGGGETGALLRAHDWSTSPLGSPESWPQSLRSVVGLLLSSKFPMFVAWGSELGFLYNDPYAAILGSKHPAALGRRFQDIWSEIWSDILPLIEAALAGEATFHQNLPLVVNRQGFDEEAWFTFSYSPVRDEQGTVAGMFCTVAETTAEVLASRRQSFRLVFEERIRDLGDPSSIQAEAVSLLGSHLDAHRAGYSEIIDESIVRPAGSYTANGVAVLEEDFPIEVFGAPIVDRQRQGITEVIHDVRSHAEPEAPVWATIDTRSIVSVPLVRDGRLVATLYVTSQTPRSWSAEDVALIEEVAARTWDAVQRARAETALRNAEAGVAEERALLATLVEHLPVGIVAVDRAGKPLLCNPAYQRIVPEAVIPSQLVQARERWLGFDEEDRRILAEEYPGARALRGETVEAAEFLHRSDDGKETWTRISAVPLRDAARGLTGALCVVVDIDAHKRAEEALRHLNERLEQLVAERTAELLKAQEALAQAQKMEAVGQLTGGIAHDFNNLLQGVSGSLELIRRRPNDVERVRRWAEAGLHAAERGAKLTAQLLAFSRAQRIQLQPVIVADLVAESHDLLARTLGPMIKLNVQLDDARVPVCSDPTQLEMAVLNLAINARDAMPDGGDLTITTKPIFIEGDPELEPGEYLELSVTDSGTGMPAEIVSRAFDPFFTTKGVGKGSGLGLSQVYGIARQAGGTARIDSQLGNGTTVRVLLPRTDGVLRDEVDPGATEIETRPRSATVLVIDDDPDVRQFVMDTLEDLGFGGLQAEDGPTGLAALERSTPDVLIVDYAMPGMTGADVARIVRSKHPGIPIIFASGYAETAAIEQAVPGGTTILRKPFRIDELHAALSEALSRSAPT